MKSWLDVNFRLNAYLRALCPMKFEVLADLTVSYLKSMESGQIQTAPSMSKKEDFCLEFPSLNLLHFLSVSLRIVLSNPSSMIEMSLRFSSC